MAQRKAQKTRKKEVKAMFAKHAGKLVLWTAAITFVFTYMIFTIIHM